MDGGKPSEWRGSPAWAGIDLTQDSTYLLGGRLPRVGGDRPHIKTPTRLLQTAPPRGRG